MSRGIGTGPGVYYDGYSFQGEGVTKDSRHKHQAIWPKFRSASEDLRKDRGLGTRLRFRERNETVREAGCPAR